MDKVKKDDRKNWFFSYNMIFGLDISSHAKLVYLFLCRCADSDSQSFPAKGTIAENCSISISTVKKALNELQEIGLLNKEDRYRGDGSQTSNLYTIFSEPEINAVAVDKIPQMEQLEEETVVGREEGKEYTKYVSTQTTEKNGTLFDLPLAESDSLQSIYTRPGSHGESHPGQNTATGGLKCDHQEVLPILSTTQKEVLPNEKKIRFEKKSVSLYGGESEPFQAQEVLLERIMKKCELHLFENQNDRKMLENALEIMWYSEFLQIGNAKIPQAMVRSRMCDLHGAILFYAMGKLKNGTGNAGKIANSTKYLVSTIYNAINEFHSDVVVDKCAYFG